MTRHSKRPLIGVLSVLLIVVFLIMVKWTADPQSTSAEPPASPSTSILFIIDSSPNMFPWDGTDYFQLAVDGILDFLHLPGFPQVGSYEIGVMQFAQLNAPGYTKARADKDGIVHWIPPTWINEPPTDPNQESDWERVVKWLGRMKPYAHPTSSLMDMGFKQAAEMFTGPDPLSQADSSTSKHVILIGTGEYRLPQPCPELGFFGEGCAQNCVGYESCVQNCDLDPGEPGYDLGAGPPTCNRACYTRCFVASLRSALNPPGSQGGRISTIRVGPEWHNYYSPSGIIAEDGGPLGGNCEDCGAVEPPYGGQPDYCNSTNVVQPDRGGFMKEITGWANDEGTQCGSTPVGGHVRIPPLVRFGCSGGECRAGTSRDIVRAIARWLCDWEETGDADGDLVRDLCDNCPLTSNPRQRDCNLDGIGDLCQQTTEFCKTGPNPTGDDDLDGLCNGLDTCDSGDDCLVRYWVADDPEASCDNPNDLSTCGCDCDGDMAADVCQAAQRFQPDTLSNTPPTALDPDSAIGFDDGTFFEPDDSSFAYDGVPDCAQGPNASCYPVPQACDLKWYKSVECANNPPCGEPGCSQVLDFVDDGIPAEYLHARGWSVDPPEAVGSLVIHDGEMYSEARNDCNKAFNGTCAGTPPDANCDCIEDVNCGECNNSYFCYGDTGNCFLYSEDRQGFLELPASIAELKSPPFVFPPTQGCSRGLADACETADCVVLNNDYSFSMVELDLLFSRDNKEWEMIVEHPCSYNTARWERAHLVARTEGTTKHFRVLTDRGAIETSEGTTDLDYWMTLRLVFANSRFYGFGLAAQGGQCEFQPYPAASVVVWRRALGDNGPGGTSNGPHLEASFASGRFEESAAQPALPWDGAGMRLVIRASNDDECLNPSGQPVPCGPLYIGRIKIGPATGCQFNTNSTLNSCGSYCSNDARVPCVSDADCGSGNTCVTGHCNCCGTSWQCSANESQNWPTCAAE